MGKKREKELQIGLVVKALCDGLNIECIIHEFPNRNDTVRLGLSALLDDVDYCFFTPGDQPLIKRESTRGKGWELHSKRKSYQCTQCRS